MKRKQVTITFTINEEWVPGMFYDPQDFATHGFAAIAFSLDAYKPTLVSSDVQDVEETSNASEA